MREHFLLDTGPLIDLLVLRYLAESRRRWPDSKFQFQALRTPLDQEDFEKFVKANRGYLGTSSGVITEIYRFLQRAENEVRPPRAQKDFRNASWRLVCATLRDLEIDERTVPVVEMKEQALADFGPTDAGLLALAMRSGDEVGGGIVVLTADRGLVELCRRHEMHAEYVHDQLAEFRKSA